MRKLAIGVIGVTVLLALVALALAGPDRSAQANHPAPPSVWPWSPIHAATGIHSARPAAGA